MVLDTVEGLPTPVLLGVALVAVVAGPIVAALYGGAVAVTALILGALGVAVSGGLLAGKVHLKRLPLELAPVAVTTRIDGHAAFGFRTRLGRGRPMSGAQASVRFVPDHGEPVVLPPMMPSAGRLLGPWTIVVIDREGRCDTDGRFEVRIDAVEGTRRWHVARDYAVDDLQTGRFAPPAIVRKGRLLLGTGDWYHVAPPALETDAP